MTSNRLEAFSDGVLAIIITIMVLGLHVPSGAALTDLWATAGTGLLSYLLSFIYVGIYWINHHHTFKLTSKVTGRVLWANLALLFFLSLLPFATAWIDGMHFARIPVIVYGIVLLLCASSYRILQRTIIHSQGEGSVLQAALGRDWKSRTSLVLYTVGIISATLVEDDRIGIWIALTTFVVVAALWFVPDRRIEGTYRELAG